MSVTIKLSSIKSIDNRSISSITEISNFNFQNLTSSISEFLTSINYIQGDDVSVDISNISADSLKLRESLTVYGNKVGLVYPENIKLLTNGSILAKNIKVDDVSSAKRIRLRVFGELPITGIPGEMVYIQAQGTRIEGIYVWLNSTGWTLLYGIGTGAGSGEISETGSMCRQLVLQEVSADLVSSDNSLISSNLFTVPAPIATDFPILYINGLQTQIGNGSKLASAYFSKDGGSTASIIGELDSTDLLYFNPTIAEYDLDTDDTITLKYLTSDPYCAQSGYYCNTISVSSGNTELSPFSINIITTPSTTGPLRVCQIPNPISNGLYTMPDNYDLSNTISSYSISDINSIFTSIIIRFTLSNSLSETDFDNIKVFNEVSGVISDVTITSGMYSPDFLNKYIYAQVTEPGSFYIVQGVIPTTTTTSTTTTTTLACPTNNISYSLEVGPNPTHVLFSGTPEGPHTLEFVDQHGTVFNITGLIEDDITLPWTLDLNNVKLLSLSTIIGVYTFTYDTSCVYTVEIPLSAITTTTTTTIAS